MGGFSDVPYLDDERLSVDEIWSRVSEMLPNEWLDSLDAAESFTSAWNVMLYGINLGRKISRCIIFLLFFKCSRLSDFRRTIDLAFANGMYLGSNFEKIVNGRLVELNGEVLQDQLSSMFREGRSKFAKTEHGKVRYD